MSALVWWVNFVGLLLTLFGSYLLFIGASKERPEEYSTNHSGSYEGLQAEKEKRVREASARMKNSKWGFGLLAVGIAFQIISFLAQYPK